LVDYGKKRLIHPTFLRQGLTSDRYLFSLNKNFA
jgi:hypothetical protein